MDICLKNPFAFSQSNEQPTETDIEELVKAFWGEQWSLEEPTALPKLLFGFVALELPNTEQTIFNVCKLNNSIALAIKKDDFFPIERIFDDSDFGYIRNKYKEFIIQGLSINNGDLMIDVNKVYERLSELGYIHERDDYFVAF